MNRLQQKLLVSRSCLIYDWKVQDSAPSLAITILAAVFAATDVAVRQRRPLTPDVQAAEVTVPPAEVQVSEPGAAPMSEAARTPHSLARPSASPIAAPAAAELRACRY